MQTSPWKLCTKTVVSRIRNQNWGTRADIVESQELRFYYRTRDWTDNQYCPNNSFWLKLDSQVLKNIRTSVSNNRESNPFWILLEQTLRKIISDDLGTKDKNWHYFETILPSLLLPSQYKYVTCDLAQGVLLPFPWFDLLKLTKQYTTLHAQKL